MPGYEVIGIEEKNEVDSLFTDAGGVLFRHSFDNLRNGVYKVREFEEEFANKLGSNHALAVSSGTAALRVALASLDIGRGDEVITQSFTFVATVESIIESGAIPICTEIDKTLNMDPADLERKITSKTKAVIVVHMLGTPANLKEIKKVCDKFNIFLIEDTAWGCGGSYEDIKLGSWGDIGTFSFDFAKTITTGEGGMLVFKDENIYKKAAAWHDHGHENNPMVPRWEDTRSGSGFNYRMSELQGAIGKAQLKKLDYIIEQHKMNKKKIEDKIFDFKDIEFREIPLNSFETAEALIFFVKDNDTAIKCRDILLRKKIGTKILPEAISWHFAGTWNHMPTLEKHNSLNYKYSRELLLRSVSIPINIHMKEEVPNLIKESLSQLFS